MENITYKLDYDKLDQGLQVLKGDHDFRLFMKEDKELEINTNRRIDDCFFKREENRLEIFFKAESFLHNQVRIMTGSLIELARGKISLEDFKAYFDPESNVRANPALSPVGLYLWEVEY